MISSGSEVIRAERMNHCLPAIELVKLKKERRCNIARTFSTENLGDAVLLVKETFLVHFIEQAALAVPRGERQKIFLSLFFGPNVAHLDYNERVFALGSGREEDVRVKLAWSAFDAVAEVPDERRGGGAVEATETEFNWDHISDV
jgi:hypothetical protein